MHPELLCIGDCTIDAFLTLQHANLHCRVNEKDCELCIKYGQKILVDRCDFSLGGNACNVAVGTSRLGLQVMLLAEIGSDEFAHKILTGLAKETINTDRMIKTPSAQTSFAVGINFQGERTLFVEHVLREHTFDFTHLTPRWVYLTSLGVSWEHVYEKTLLLITQGNVKLACNPGSHQLKERKEIVEKVIAQTDVLFVNKDEAKTLVGHYRGKIVDDTKTLIEELHLLGAKTVVLTNGKEGSFVFLSERVFHAGILASPVVERTGAGDAYSAGFLAAILLGHSTADAMRWGTKNAASVVGKIGAQAGLLTRYHMEKVVDEAEIAVREL